ncbi:MAG: hypothetical protein M3Q50_11250 [Chloroflexota bacterium]|nr:hypothetical protein [Chloroflexota bacterium]
MTARGWQGKSAAEWVTLALSVLMVGALVGVALVEESRRQEGDGAGLDVTFDTEQTVARGDTFNIPYTVHNTGPNAISSAEIWIDVFDGNLLKESAEVTVQFLPLEGKQDGVFVTTFDPATHTLMGRLESLQYP